VDEFAFLDDGRDIVTHHRVVERAFVTELGDDESLFFGLIEFGLLLFVFFDGDFAVLFVVVDFEKVGVVFRAELYNFFLHKVGEVFELIEDAVRGILYERSCGVFENEEQLQVAQH